MSNTEPALWVGKPYEGYSLNASFSKEGKATLQPLLGELQKHLGVSAYVMPPDSLHITLFDFLAPLLDYDGQNKAVLLNKVRPRYERTLKNILKTIQPFEVVFDELHVSPSTIYLQGHDDGQFAEIRKQFVEQIDLIPGTKLPPTIIHSSLVRFTQAVPLEGITNYVNEQQIHVVQPIDHFRLIHSSVEPMLQFEVLERYPLGVQDS